MFNAVAKVKLLLQAARPLAAANTDKWQLQTGQHFIATNLMSAASSPELRQQSDSQWHSWKKSRSTSVRDDNGRRAKGVGLGGVV